jgi:N-acetyl-anhydromuramyl-L-alanine amidase AmpD
MQDIKWIGAANYSKGRQGYRPGAIVIHIMQGSLTATDSWFRAAESKVSAHYGIGRTGEVHQYVAEGDTAYHAGRVKDPTWSLIKPGINPNLYTVGIEHEGMSGEAWPEALYDTSAALVAEAALRWAIPLDRDHVIGHYEIYSPKAFCPGSGVDLETLIEMAKAQAQSPETYNFVASKGKVKTRVSLNVRRGAPTSDAPIVRTLAAGKTFSYVGWTSNGQSVHGNSHWYRDAQGNYAWAGGTLAPVPS